MWEKTDVYQENLSRLLKAFRGNTFKFIIIQYNHQDIIHDLVISISEKYPNLSVKRIEARDMTYNGLMAAFEKNREGIFYISDFEELLDQPNLYIGFNQRRDKIASNPIQLLAFIPRGKNHVRNLQDRIPDFWAFRSFLLEFFVEYTSSAEFDKISFDFESVHFSKLNQELENLESRISQSNLSEPEQHLNLLIRGAEICLDLLLLEKGNKWLKEASSLSKQLNLENKSITRYTGIVLLEVKYHHKKEEYKLALNKLKLLRDIHKNEGSVRNLAVIRYHLGIILRSLKDYDKSLHEHNSSKKLFEELNDNLGLASNCQEIGRVYGEQKKYEKALEQYEKALKIFIEIKSEPNIAKTLLLLGVTSSNEGRYTKAIEQYLKSYSLAKQMDDLLGQLVVCYYLGKAYVELKNYNAALESLLNSSKISSYINFPEHEEIQQTIEQIKNSRTQ